MSNTLRMKYCKHGELIFSIKKSFFCLILSLFIDDNCRRQNVGAYYEVAQYYMDNGQFEDALHHYKEALFILKQRFPSNHYVIGETLMTIARTYAEIAKLHHVSIENCPNMIKCRPVDHENIIQYLSQAQQILLQNVAPTHPDLLFIYGAIELSQSFLESASVSEG